MKGGIHSRNWRQIFTKVACVLQHLDGQVGTVVNPKEERIGQLVPRSVHMMHSNYNIVKNLL